ncbi:DUF2164 family protein [Halomonas caseinilytica]|uniref:DUF2164 family protein n=1 Tax=Halomonas caseinilytica TaxID=438744 RepID=UPI0009F26555|nr:DUF2164 family protein [Halomonas caseinilytica]
MNKNRPDAFRFSNELKKLLLTELDISVGNMEIIPLSEKIYDLVRRDAYNEGVIDAKIAVEKKLEDIDEQLDMLLKDAP